MVACGKALLGRIIDAQGNPLDGRPPVKSPFQWPLAGRKVNPLRRGRVTKPLNMGVRAINGLLTVGEGQRVAIVAGSGVGKRSEEHTSELQSLMRISYAVFCLKKKNK